MTIPAFLIRFNPARPAVDGRGVFTKEVADALTRLFEAYNASVAETNEMLGGLEAAQYASVAPRAPKADPAIISQPAADRSGLGILIQR